MRAARPWIATAMRAVRADGVIEIVDEDGDIEAQIYANEQHAEASAGKRLCGSILLSEDEDGSRGGSVHLAWQGFGGGSFLLETARDVEPRRVVQFARMICGVIVAERRKAEP
jgi:hypothetical protein